MRNIPVRELRHPWERRAKNGSHILSHSMNPIGDSKIATEHQDMVRSLAKVLMARGLDLNIPRHEMDKEALAFWLGAATALRLAGYERLSEDVAKIGALEIAPRGFQAVTEIATS